jgi:lipopolysaccharide biosynthesis glycosyltransferase
VKPLVAFCPADHSPQNEKFFNQLQNSLRKFHSEEELPLIRYDLADNQDPNKWYKATPMIARELLKEYETVIKLDADQIITGSLSDIWEGEFDVATVLNDPSYPIQVLDITPYFNNGLVVMKNPEFVEHWWRLCNSEHFLRFQYREQDLLNILCSDYLNYKVHRLEDNKIIYGESAKPLWATAQLTDGKLMAGDKQVNVIHFGGGNSPDKGNIKIRFQPEVVKFLEELIK